jgi:hypothetical protein
MLELASLGAKVLQTRSVELAMKERVRVQVLSSFATDDVLGGDLPGTPGRATRMRSWNRKSYQRHRLLARRGEDHRPPYAGPAGRGGGDLRAAGRRQHQRRHDRAERAPYGDRDRPHLHRVGKADLPRAPWRCSRREGQEKIGYRRA